MRLCPYSSELAAANFGFGSLANFGTSPFRRTSQCPLRVGSPFVALRQHIRPRSTMAGCWTI